MYIRLRQSIGVLLIAALIVPGFVFAQTADQTDPADPQRKTFINPDTGIKTNIRRTTNDDGTTDVNIRKTQRVGDATTTDAIRRQAINRTLDADGEVTDATRRRVVVTDEGVDRVGGVQRTFNDDGTVDVQRLQGRQNAEGDRQLRGAQGSVDADGSQTIDRVRKQSLVGDEAGQEERRRKLAEAQEKHEAAQKRHKATREQLGERKQLRTEALDGARDARDSFRSARDNFRTNTSDERKEELLEKARSFLTRLLNSMLRHLEALEGRVSNAENLNDGVKSNILAQISSEKTWVTEALSRVPSLTTVEEVKALSADAKEKWRSTFLVSQRLSGRFLASRLENFLEKLMGAQERVDAKLVALEAEGFDVSTITELSNLMDGALNNARASLDRALTLFSSLTASDNPKGTYQEAMSALREGHGQIKEAHRILNEIIKELKTLARTSGLTADDESDDGFDEGDEPEDTATTTDTTL